MFDERGAETVEKVLSESVMSMVNLAEEGMNTVRLEEDLGSLGSDLVRFEATDARFAEDVRRAGRREWRRLALGDCCCLATAIRLKLPVVSGDQAWEALRLGVEVHPFR